LYGCEIWSLTLSEEHKLRALNIRMLRKISGPERDEVTGQRRLYKDHKKNENGGGETYRENHRGT
jgi:hypothetical protein